MRAVVVCLLRVDCIFGVCCLCCYVFGVAGCLLIVVWRLVFVECCLLSNVVCCFLL